MTGNNKTCEFTIATNQTHLITLPIPVSQSSTIFHFVGSYSPIDIRDGSTFAITLNSLDDNSTNGGIASLVLQLGSGYVEMDAGGVKYPFRQILL